MDKPVGIQRKHADSTKTHDVPPPPDYLSMNLKCKDASLLRNGMLNLDLDIVSALLTVDDALMSTSSIEDLPENLTEQLICVKKLLNKSLHSLRDWQTYLSGEYGEKNTEND